MTDEDLELAYKVMGMFINSVDPKRYTIDNLMIRHAYDEETATRLANDAYKEWSQAYGS